MKSRLTKFVMLLFALTMAMPQQNALAKKISLSIADDHPIFDNTERRIPRSAFEAIPQIDYEKRTLTFHSKVHIMSMEVTIKDKKGKVTYHDYVDLTNGVTTVKLTEKESEHAFSIELFYADIHVVGHF